MQPPANFFVIREIRKVSVSFFTILKLFYLSTSKIYDMHKTYFCLS